MSSTIPDSSQSGQENLSKEVARRRTFAIISHPDAGKTTLTEKLLLYTGAVHLAGAVRTRKNQRHATSDWMAMEQERGISITATALEMEYQGYRINLLDTPGHQDFSEDTYRTLMAVDSAVMVLDSAKGIETQTEKLFHVCRMRGIPILTFINKMDHEGRDPLELLGEIERILGLAAVPVNWPIGTGSAFQGVYDLNDKQVLRFEHTERGGEHRAPVTVTGLDDPALKDLLGEQASRDLHDQVDLLAGAGVGFDREQFLAGKQTPVFFGSALNNFGVEPFLSALLAIAPAPQARETNQGLMQPTDTMFTGFVFKIQANMDRRHRDRMAFVRVCSGRFEKDMVVNHPRAGKEVRISRVYRLFAQERETVEEAFPGDVIGVINPGLFAIGDSITSGKAVQFAQMPRFSPEHFAVLINKDIVKYKQFHKGLSDLEEEGAVQIFYASGKGIRPEPILAAVGELQFDVVLSRLQDEYGVETSLQRLPYQAARWVSGQEAPMQKLLGSVHDNLMCKDAQEQLVLLFQNDWNVKYYESEHPEVTFAEFG